MFHLAKGSIAQFTQAQFNKADQQGIPCPAIGDFNSIALVELDSWQGSHIFRQNYLAARLAASDSTDVFRIRHPDLRTFTYFARTYRRVDHAPVRTNFSNPPQWRQLAHVINSGSEANVGALHQQVETNLEEYVPLLQHVQLESARLSVQPANLFPALHEGLDGIVWAGVEDRPTCALQWESNKAYEVVHDILHRCPPNPFYSLPHLFSLLVCGQPFTQQCWRQISLNTSCAAA